MKLLKNKKVLILIIIIILILIFSFLEYKKREGVRKLNSEDIELINFQKEWNKNLPKLKEEIKKGKFDKIKAKNSKWERYKIPYTEPLPEYPDKWENNKDLFGVDANNNGVRDDLEILAVKKFWDDRDVVEIFFAESRRHDFNTYIYINNLINNQNIKKYLKYIDISVSCYMDTGDYVNIVNKKYYNTLKRKQIKKESFNNLGWQIIGGFKSSKDKCFEWVSKTKTWNFRKK